MFLLHFLRFPFFLAVIPSNWATHKCGKGTLTTRHGFFLKGHVFHTFPSENLMFCYSACNTNPACQSANYNLITETCDLNSELGRSHPGSLHKSDFHVYADNPDRGKKGSSAISPGLSCKNIKDSGDFNTSGTYWIKPRNSDRAFKAYCQMSAIGQWMKVTQSWVMNTLSGGVSLTHSGGDSGLKITGQVKSYGCGKGPSSGALTLLKGYWTRIKYTQEFRGQASCWSIFGDNKRGGTSLDNHPTGLHPFNASAGDSITDQYFMGGDTHEFDGNTSKCDNKATNFWRNTRRSLRYATVVLRRNLTAEKAGIFTGTSCGTPSYTIKNIFVEF